VAGRFATVDEYIGSLPADVQVIVREVRRAALAAAPDAQDAIRYQIPTLTLGGTSLVHYAAWTHFLSVYPVPRADAALRTELTAYEAGKGTLRFPLDRPVPYDLIERVVAQLRIERAS
jgi:uncharacterized protein YdhG (YjbR/CyaY superfamily)